LEKELSELNALNKRLQAQADELARVTQSNEHKLDHLKAFLPVPEEKGFLIPGFLSWKETNDFFLTFKS
jgi:hypothetical protein